jgi:hypothetical protein
MCGNEAIISDEHDIDKNEKKQQQELETSNITIEQIDGTCYIFDTANCAMMFKRFSAVDGSNIADE